MTLGVRGLVIESDKRIFVVTHTYASGWQLPGGGVEPGETVAEALARELLEEGNIEISEPPVSHGIFFNSRVSQRDHVVLFVVRSFRQTRAPAPTREIAAHGFFSLTLFPRIRQRQLGLASRRSFWVHPFQNGGDEMGIRARGSTGLVVT
jgi:8-oxo-dGTP pyrophosphatase MutT (NUDIX family)